MTVGKEKKEKKVSVKAIEQTKSRASEGSYPKGKTQEGAKSRPPPQSIVAPKAAPVVVPQKAPLSGTSRKSEVKELPRGVIKLNEKSTLFANVKKSDPPVQPKRQGANKPGASTLFDFCLVAGKKTDDKAGKVDDAPPRASGGISLVKLSTTNKVNTSATSIPTKASSIPTDVARPIREVAITPAMSKIFEKAIVRKKKKKMSTIKKKILIERMNRHRKMILEAEEKARAETQGLLVGSVDNEKVPDTHGTTNSSEECTVQLQNFASVSEVLDEEEWTEIRGNILELMQPFGTVSNIFFKLPNTSDEMDMDHAFSLVYVTFETKQAARLASLSIDGLTFGGSTVKATTLDANSLVLPDEVSEEGESTTRISSKHAVKSSKFRLNLENLVFLQDIADQEEVQEVLYDIESLCTPFGGIKTVWIETKSNELIPQKLSDSTFYRNNMPENTQPPTYYDLPLGLVEFQNLKEAIDTVNKLQGKEIGGSVIEAYLFDYPSYLHGTYRTSSLIPCSDACNIQSTNIEAKCFGIKISKLVDSSQMIDDDERQQIFEDTHSILSYSFHRNGQECEDLLSQGHLFFVPEVTLIPDHGKLEGDSNGTSDSNSFMNDAFFIFSTTTHGAANVALMCSQSVEYLDGLTIAGVEISASLIAVSQNVLKDVQLGKVGIDALQSCNVVCEKRATGAVVALLNLFDKDEIEGAEDEEMIEFKRNLISLCREAHDQTMAGYVGPMIRRVSISPGVMKDDSNEKINDLTHAPLIACVEFADVATAEQAMLHLDSCVIGGNHVKAYLSFNDGNDESESEHEDFKDTTNQTLGGEGNASTVPSDLNASIATAIHPPQVCKQSENAPTRIDNAQVTKESTAASVPDKAADGEILPASTGSIYAEAKLAPKLEKRSSASPDRNIAIATPEIEVIVKEMLTTLATFQKRAIERDKVKGIQTKMRFVMGMKQCTNGVKVGKALLVLMAPDIEQSEVLDGGLNFLLTEAAAREIPVLSCLSRRRLGKALMSSMRQTVVAIYSADGVYDSYKAIVSFIGQSSAKS